MNTHRMVVITSLVLVTLLITTGVVFALGIGAVNQGTVSTAEGDFSTVSGGRNNNIPDTGDFATIGGGQYNAARGSGSTTSGGMANYATGSLSAIGGGGSNRADGVNSTVSGGQLNTASGQFSTIGGGGGTFISRDSVGNTASGTYSTIGGGRGNTASGAGSTIGGGAFSRSGVGNTASGTYSTIGGGAGNTADGVNSTVSGGQLNTASGFFPTIPGGLENSAQGRFSFAAGHRAKANHDGTFVWADSITEDFASTQSNQFLIRASGGVGIGTNNPQEELDVNGEVRAKDFIEVSSKRWKTNIQTIEGALEKVQNLRGVSFDWKADGKHDIGLIAEEVGQVVPEVVVFEENGQDATAVGYAGLVPVLIEALKEQQQLLEEKDAQIVVLQEDDHEFEARIAALEKSLGAEAKEAQIGSIPFNISTLWMMVGGLGLGLVLVTPGLVLGYRRIRRYE